MRSLFAIFLVMCTTALQAQENQESESNNLGDQYNELKSKSNNYQIYKVVKEASLDAFWASVSDTLANERKEITSLKAEVKNLKSEVSSLNNQVSERDEALEEQAYQIDHMSFLGIQLTKGTYITVTWIIIFALLITALVLYFRFQSAHSVTAKTKKEFNSLQEEFDAHRQRTRDNETKLKRDLQTEINRVEELKAQLEGNA
jgi:peptidoglycan hydrolase CwlO-like protein